MILKLTLLVLIKKPLFIQVLLEKLSFKQKKNL